MREIEFMSAERVKNNKGGLKEALCVTGIGNEETSLYLWSVALTKALWAKIGGDGWKKKLIVEKSSYTIAEEANKKSTAVAQG